MYVCINNQSVTCMKNNIKKKLQSLLPGRSWWGNLMCGFLGSCLGIIVTFGTSQYLDNRTQKKMERNLLVLSIADFGNQIHDMERLYNKFLYEDSIYNYINENDAEDMPKDSIDICLSTFLTADISVITIPTKNIIDSNSEMLKNMTDLSLLAFINNSKAIKDEFSNVIAEDKKEREKVLYSFMDRKSLSDYERAQELMEALQEALYTAHYFLMHKAHTVVLGMFTNMLKNIRQNIIERTGITDEEINKTKANFTYSEHQKIDY